MVSNLLYSSTDGCKCISVHTFQISLWFGRSSVEKFHVLVPFLAQLRARLLITGNLSVSIEDPSYLWGLTTTNNHSTLTWFFFYIYFYVSLSKLNITGDLYNLWRWHGKFNTSLIAVTKIILFTFPYLNSYCPDAPLPSNWHLHFSFLSNT
jgi:hypothetical protein